MRSLHKPTYSKPTYSQRLFVWLLGYSLIILVGMVAFQYSREKAFKTRELDGKLQIVNAYIAGELASGVSPRDIDIRRLNSFGDLRVSIIDSAGRVVYDTSLDTPPEGSHLEREEIREALLTGSGYDVRRHSETTGETYFYSAHLTPEGMVVRTAVPYSAPLGKLLEADYGFLWVMGIIMAVMCVVGYAATRRLGQNVERLSRFAKAAERGEGIAEESSFPHDELGSISSDIVRLYVKLRGAVEERDRQHREAMHQQREKERIKKQLTNNINHELKTPVASVQACLETIAQHPEMEASKREEFVRRALAAVGRLNRLLGDVALLTRLEDAPGAVAMEPVDLSEVVADICADKEAEATAKGMTIADRLPAGIMVEGNEGLIASVFYNLLANAIAYSGGTRVEISKLRGAPGLVVVEVADDGVGVAEEHLPHLFERFYRIDKGRSRALGGTGLGLAIVKNAMAVHGGKVSVARRPDGGLAFTLTFRSFTET